MVVANDNLVCRYIGSGNFNRLAQTPVADNEVLIYTDPVDERAVLIRGFLESIRSEEVRKKVPQEFSENDLAAVIVEMVRNLLDSLLVEFDRLSNGAKMSSSDSKVVVCAVISW
jgi:hypothetical protein